MGTPLSLLLLACAGDRTDAPATTPTPSSAPSLVIVTLDTVRADHIGAYGYATAHTPTIDGIAKRGIRFDRAYTDVPLTTPAHASIFTGLHPTHHGVHTNGGTALRDDVTTLAEVLDLKGYATAAIASAFVTSRAWNLDQGFQTYDDAFTAVHAVKGRWMQERKANDTVDKALAWLATDRPAQQPFFLWLHFYDAHFPYEPPPPFSHELVLPYDGEIAYIDSELGRLMPKVEEAAGPGGVVWVLVADHGEALDFEHGEPTHGAYLFEPTVHVPFVVRPAKPLDTGVVVPNVVSIVDVMPTALDLLGLPVPDGLDGIDEAGWARHQPVEDRPHAYMESQTLFQRFGYHPEIAFVEGSYKLMDTPSPRLYDVVADPLEKVDRFADEPDVVAKLRAHIAATRANEQLANGTMDAANLQALESLGYVGATAPSDPGTALVDGKDRVDVLGLMDKARNAAQTREGTVEAVAIYDKVLAIDPNLAEAWSARANALVLLGHVDEAIENVMKALVAHPDSAVLETQLAALQMQQRNFEGALETYEKGLTHSPKNQYLRGGLLRALLQLDRRDDAIAKARAWLAQDPDALYLKGMLGVVLTQAGQSDEAEALLRASLADPIPQPWVHYSLALIAYHKKDLASAADELGKEVTAFPGDATQGLMLGKILFEAKRYSEAAAAFADVAAGNEKPNEGRIGWAQATVEAGDAQKASEILEPLLSTQKESLPVLAIHHRILVKLGKTEEAAQADKEFKAMAQKLQKRKETEAAQAKKTPPKP